MYRSATKTNHVFFQRLSVQCPIALRVQLHLKDLLTTNNFKPLANSGVGDSHRHICRVHPPHVHLPNPYNFQTLRLWRYLALPVKPLSETHCQNSIPLQLHVASVRLFSGKSDEKENIEKKQTATLSIGSDKEGKDNGCKAEKQGKQSSEASSIPDRGQTEILHEQDPALKNSERQQPSLDKHPDPDKRKKDQKLHTPKKINRRKPERRKPPAETDPAKKIGEYDRLQLLKEKLIRKLGKRWLSWKDIKDTFDDFPYYISENTRDLLIECAAARLKQHKFSKFGEALPSSSHLILLHGQPGTEIYQEVLVRALARHLKVSLLVLDRNFLAAKELKESQISGLLLDDDDDDDDDKGTAHKTWQVGKNGKAEDVSVKAAGNLVIFDCRKVERKLGKPWKLPHVPADEEINRQLGKPVSVEDDPWTEELEKLADEVKKRVLIGREAELKNFGKEGEELKKFWHDLTIGDRVKFLGPKDSKAKSRSKVRVGQEGYVASISDGLPWKVCVKFQGRHGADEADEVFCDAGDLEKVEQSCSHESWLAKFPELPIEALCKMVLYRNPVIVHFPDIQQWFARAAPAKGRGSFFNKVGDMLSKVDGPVVFIAGRIKENSGTATVSDFSIIEELFQPVLFEMPNSNEADEENLKGIDRIYKIFKNVIKILPPEEPQLLQSWQKQLEANKKTAMRRKNQLLLEKSLAHYAMGCSKLSEVDTLDLQITRKSAEKAIGWARNMSLRNNVVRVNEGKLWLEKECLERSLARLKALKGTNEDKITHITELAENDYEKSLLSSVILAEDIGVKFDEIGALDDVKNTLRDLIILPLQRPELFAKGNLRKPCKGVLLFGPPGTGKTILAKAVATEAGANFINVSASSITSKYYGDDEKLVKALFSLARKLTPAVIFVDEVDSLLGARGGSSEHEATRRIKNEFMAAWDGLQSKETEQILVLATTNRPFDLDDAVIRRLPRRLLVDLPNAENRVKILRIILANEDLVDTFDFTELAAQTDGYSGSDMKNLCLAAAYRPIREYLVAEEQGKVDNSSKGHQSVTYIRPLCLEDFIQAKSMIGTSIAYDAASMVQLRRWNEQYGEGGRRTQRTFGFSQ